MGLMLVSRLDAGWPTSWPVSLVGAATGSTTSVLAGTVDASSAAPGSGFGVDAFGTTPFGG